MRPSSQAGFTLLEVLVALVIASLALGALFSGAVTGMRSAALSTHYSQAVSRARSHLAVIEASGPIVAGTREGDDGGGFRWRLRVRQLAMTSISEQAGAIGNGGNAPIIALYGIAMVISWKMDGGERQVTLETQRISVVPPSVP
jgi:general secretion pathway protein I